MWESGKQLHRSLGWGCEGQPSRDRKGSALLGDEALIDKEHEQRAADREQEAVEAELCGAVGNTDQAAEEAADNGAGDAKNGSPEPGEVLFSGADGFGNDACDEAKNDPRENHHGGSPVLK